MERRLFDDLVLSRSGGGHARAGAMPFSIAMHAAGLTALLAVSMVVREELPVPPSPGLRDPIALSPTHVFQSAGAAPSTPRRAAPLRPAARPTLEVPSADPQPGQFDPSDVRPGDGSVEDGGCVGCRLDGAGTVDGVPGGDPLGTGTTATPEPVRPGGNIRAPRNIRHFDPVYPALARNAGVGGVVILECVIDRDGRVRAVRVLRGFPLLNDAATDAVRQWTYTPTLLNGVPVEVVMTVTVRFAIH